MNRTLRVLRCGPGTTVQDLGRTGRLEVGLSCGGSMDVLAHREGAALLGQPAELAAIELTGTGGSFSTNADIRIALTGAAARAEIDGERIACYASHWLRCGQTLTIAHSTRGNYGYLHVGGGIDTPPFLNSRSTHVGARIGDAVGMGSLLPIGEDSSDRTGLTMDIPDRFSGGVLRVVPSVQTSHFDTDTLSRLQETEFTRDTYGNRVGARLAFEGLTFSAERQFDILSESVVPGDIQIVGEGVPFVLLCECQTTGGYPRIGTVIPPDIPLIAQARPGDPIRIQFIDRDDGIVAYRGFQSRLTDLPRTVRPLIRNPGDIPDLLAYQLIGGAVTGNEEEIDDRFHRS